jgi:hypothetical protein
MNQKLKAVLLVFLIAAILVGVTYTVATVVYNSQHNSTLTVDPTPTPTPTPPTITFTELINGTVVAHNAAIDFGHSQPGTVNNSTLAITNIGNCNFTLTVTVQGLPSGWSFSFDGNGAVIQPTHTLIGTIAITVPVGATIGTSSFILNVSGS